MRARAKRKAVWLLGLAAGALAATSCGSRVVLTDLDALEAQRCAIVLRSAGLQVDVEQDEGGSGQTRRLALHGDEADYRSALQVLEEHGLPHRAVAGLGAESSSLIPSPTEERARYTKGLSNEIEAMLESIDGVVATQVIVSLPERRPLATTSTDEASASAVVSFRGPSAPVTDEEVRAVVVRAVGASLAPERVTVVLKPVVRDVAERPIVRYERDRATEIAFLASVVGLCAIEAVTVWLLRSRRLARTVKEASDERDS